MKTLNGLLVLSLLLMGSNLLAANTFKGKIPELKELAGKDVKQCERARKKICGKSQDLEACMKKKIPDFKPKCRVHFMRQVAEKQSRECGEIIEQLCSGDKAGEDCVNNQWNAIPSNCKQFVSGKLSKKDQTLMNHCSADINKNCKYDEQLGEKDRQAAEFKFLNCVRKSFSKFNQKCRDEISALPDKNGGAPGVQTIP